MGICQSSDASGTVTKTIDKSLVSERNQDARVVKILLLGAGESGKSTIFKQLKILHNDGFTKQDRQNYAVIIRKNLVESTRILVDGLKSMNMTIPDELKGDIDALKEMEEGAPQMPSQARVIKTLWECEPIQAVYKQRNRLQLADNAAHYLDMVEKIADPQYEPTDQDIVNSRVRSSGIVEMLFAQNNIDFRLVDVGGQRSERRKWIHCFDNVQAVLFVAAISEYDQTLWEDPTANRMTEALALFEQICNSRFFQQTSMILFLNKRDIFEQKIKETDLSTCFPDYKGGNDYNKAVEFVEEQFQAVNKQSDKVIYTHVTCATDTGNVRFVFEAARDVIMMNALNGTGFM